MRWSKEQAIWMEKKLINNILLDASKLRILVSKGNVVYHTSSSLNLNKRMYPRYMRSCHSLYFNALMVNLNFGNMNHFIHNYIINYLHCNNLGCYAHILRAKMNHWWETIFSIQIEDGNYPKENISSWEVYKTFGHCL